MNKNIRIEIIKKKNLENFPNYLDKFYNNNYNKNIVLGTNYFKLLNIFLVKYKIYIIILIIILFFIKIYLKK